MNCVDVDYGGYNLWFTASAVSCSGNTILVDYNQRNSQQPSSCIAPVTSAPTVTSTTTSVAAIVPLACLLVASQSVVTVVYGGSTPNYISPIYQIVSFYLNFFV